VPVTIDASGREGARLQRLRELRPLIDEHRDLEKVAEPPHATVVRSTGILQRSHDRCLAAEATSAP
jgi:hypothetical protein